MEFSTRVRAASHVASLEHNVLLPRRQQACPSPPDWRDEIIYFLLVDRFSDGREDARPLVQRGNPRTCRPGGADWSWQDWAQSGSERWQGGTLAGVASKLDYLQGLGVSTIWLSPVFKQRGHLDTYHGYGVQDFLDVDPRFGSRADLIDLVGQAHARGMRVLLDIIFNHSGCNWLYPGDVRTESYTCGRHPFGAWRGATGTSVDAIRTTEDGVWPCELQDPDSYTRAGSGSLGHSPEDLHNPDAEHKRTDFEDLRDFNLGDPRVLGFLANAYKFWIAATDADGFRIDTLKHVSLEQARNFCGAIKEFAAGMGKLNFLLLGEVAGGDTVQNLYLDTLGCNLDAVLDIGEMRLDLVRLAKGLAHPREVFGRYDITGQGMPSHRALGNKYVSVCGDHDHVFGEKVRFSSEACTEHQVAAAAALQLFCLGIPCLYYGDEQALGGPEPGERQWLPGWKVHDRYLREAMFGPAHPLRAGRDGTGGGLDPDLPGFGPYGTAGHHCFDPAHPAYVRIAAMAATRRQFPALRHGRQYPRPTSFLDSPFGLHGPGELLAWSRILDDEECVCILNVHGSETRGGDVLVDSGLNPEGGGFFVLLNTAQAAAGGSYAGPHPAGSHLPVRRAADGTHYVELRGVPPSELILLSRYPQAERGDIRP